MSAALIALLTEARDELKAEPEMWELVGRIDAALAAAPEHCEWTNCPTRVGDVCCKDAQPTAAAPEQP